MPKETPTSAEELEDRYNLIEGLMARFSRPRVMEFLERTGAIAQWGVSERQVRYYFETVEKRMSEKGQSPDANFYRQRELLRFDHIYNRASAQGDLARMESVTKNEIVLLGTNRPSAQEDWKAAAKRIGVDPENFLEVMVKRYNEMEALANGDESDVDR